MVLKAIAVTGAAGMLGRHIVGALNAHGFQPVSFGRSPGGASARAWDLSEWKSTSDLDALFASVDAVVHAGAAVPSASRPLDDRALFDANVRGSTNLADWARARGVPVVYVSGAIVYADVSAKGIPEDAAIGWSGLGGFYGLTKLLAEDVLRREEQAGLRLAVLRPTSIYGHGLGPEKMVTSLAGKAARGEVIELTEPVADSTNLIHAADVAAAVVRVLQREAWATFNLGAPTNTSVLDLAHACVDVTGSGLIEIKREGHARQAYSRFQVNCAAAERALAWSPRLTLVDGIRSVINETTLVLS